VRTKNNLESLETIFVLVDTRFQQIKKPKINPVEPGDAFESRAVNR
jgi:hypothetical protein